VEAETEKEYLVRVREPLIKNIVNIFQKGMETASLGKLLPAKAEVESDHNLRVILREGKKHQIRVMLAELKYTVESLKRVRIGRLKLGDLQPGQTRSLTEEAFNLATLTF
jgi:23S rRNA pseudouridine2604 synthase